MAPNPASDGRPVKVEGSSGSRTTAATAASSGGNSGGAGVAEAAVKQENRAAATATSSSASPASSGGGGGSRKRRSAGGSGGSDAAAANNKRATREVDFHRRKVEDRLRDATRYAKEGNRGLMDYSIEQATSHRDQALLSAEVFEQRIASIRGLLGDEKGYHARRLESKLQQAARYAGEGNRKLMEFSIGQSKEHREPAGMSADAFEQRIASIRGLFGDEKIFHARQLDSKLQEAARYAGEGDRSLMEHCIRAAMEHAGGAGVSGAASGERVAKIRAELDGGSGGDVKAEAKGKRKKNEVQPTRHVVRGGRRHDPSASPPPSSSRAASGSAAAVAAAAAATNQQSDDGGENRGADANNNSNNSQEVVVEKQMSLEQILQKKKEDAEASGDAVDLSS